MIEVNNLLVRIGAGLLVGRLLQTRADNETLKLSTSDI